MVIEDHQKEKEKSYLKNMSRETIASTSSKQSLEIPKISKLLKNIASVPKLDKQDVINNQTLRFKWKYYVFF